MAQTWNRSEEVPTPKRQKLELSVIKEVENISVHSNTTTPVRKHGTINKGHVAGPLDTSTLPPIQSKTPWRPEEKPPTEFKIETSPRFEGGWSKSLMSSAAERIDKLPKKLFLSSSVNVVQEDTQGEFEAQLEAKTMLASEETMLYQEESQTGRTDDDDMGEERESLEIPKML